MVFVHNPNRGTADLVILAAQDFTGQPVARVHLPAKSRSASAAAGLPTSNPDKDSLPLKVSGPARWPQPQGNPHRVKLARALTAAGAQRLGSGQRAY
jgi:hypothetical protein